VLSLYWSFFRLSQSRLYENQIAIGKSIVSTVHEAKHEGGRIYISTAIDQISHRSLSVWGGEATS
jgi:hypothetical protein